VLTSSLDKHSGLCIGMNMWIFVPRIPCLWLSGTRQPSLHYNAKLSNYLPQCGFQKRAHFGCGSWSIPLKGRIALLTARRYIIIRLCALNTCIAGTTSRIL
jgi:hypothetical protein